MGGCIVQLAVVSPMYFLVKPSAITAVYHTCHWQQSLFFLLGDTLPLPWQPSHLLFSDLPW